MLPCNLESYSTVSLEYSRASSGVGGQSRVQPTIIPEFGLLSYSSDTTPSSTKYLDISMARQLAHAFMMDVPGVIPLHEEF